jgi:alanyl-tRNA synthetase
LDNLTREEIRFARTIESGTAQLENLLAELRASNQTTLNGRRAFDLYATYGLPFEISRDIAREHGLDVDEEGFKVAREEHSLASGGGKAMGKTGGEDAEFFAGILKDLHKHKKLGEHGVEYDPYTSLRVEGEVLALVANGQSVQSVSFGDQVQVVLPKTGFYIESGGQVDDTGYIRSSEGSWEIEVTSMRRASAGVIVHVGEVISGQPKVGDHAIAEVDIRRRHDVMRNHTATHLLHAALHQVLGEHARQAGSLVAPDRLRFDFNHPEAMTPEQIERVEQIVNEAVAADMEVTPKLKAREDAIAEGAMALFGEKYGETVRTITIMDVEDTMSSSQKHVSGLQTLEEAAVHPAALMEHQSRYSYELCGGTHLERTSDVGAFLIVSEGSAAAGVRRIEAVTGRGAYDLIAHRFKLLKHTAAILKSAAEEVPFKVESLQDEVADLKKELASLRAQQAMSMMDSQLSSVQKVKDVNVLAMQIPNSSMDTLRMLADRFREKFPTEGIAVLASGSTVISAVTNDIVSRGIKAGDLITGIGGRGGGRPNMAQGSLPDAAMVKDAMGKVAKVVEEKLK